MNHPMTPEAILSASSVDGESVQTLSENFDNTWFRAMIQCSKKDNPIAVPRGDSKDDDDDDLSQDVFNVSVDDLCDKSKASSAASAITEWMKSIRVVTTSDAKTTLSTSSSLMGSEEEPEYCSTEPSSASTLEDDQSSLDQTSLEQSMASSSIGDIMEQAMEDDHSGMGTRIQKMEV
jgi:hypothetical protein